MQLRRRGPEISRKFRVNDVRILVPVIDAHPHLEKIWSACEQYIQNQAL